MAERIGADVPRVGGRTASFDGLDDLEDRILGRRRVRGKRDLAGTSAMRSLSLEVDGLRLTNRHDVHLCHCIDTFALLAVLP